MEVRAIAKFVRVQPRKVRLVANEVKGKPAVMSAHVLGFHPSKGAYALRKVLVSAIANAAENHGIAGENLRIAEIRVDEGPRLKRIEQRAMGRGNRIQKRMSHITVVVEDYDPAAPVKPHGTKAKSRPKFDAPKKGKKTEAKVAAPAEETPGEATQVEEVVAAEESAPVEEVTAIEETAVAEEPAAETAPTEEAPAAEEAQAEEAKADEAPADEEKKD